VTIIQIHHAQITIPKGKEEQGRIFYCDLLGLPEIEKPETLHGRGGIWLQVGDRQVHVGTEYGVDRNATKAHIAYEVTDVEEWKAKLQQHGVTILDSVPIPGYMRFETRDPFGNRIELLQPLYVSQSQKSPAQIFLIPVERHPLIQTYKNTAQLFPLAIET
jgi:catechol 2,3-dioxygenase-like lactoylglutathione lyase family enzyme